MFPQAKERDSFPKFFAVDGLNNIQFNDYRCKRFEVTMMETDPRQTQAIEKLNKSLIRYLLSKKYPMADSEDFSAELIAKICRQNSSWQYFNSQIEMILNGRIPYHFRQEVGSVAARNCEKRRKVQASAEKTFAIRGDTYELDLDRTDILEHIESELRGTERLAFRALRKSGEKEQAAAFAGVTARTISNYIYNWRKKFGSQVPFSTN